MNPEIRRPGEAGQAAAIPDACPVRMESQIRDAIVESGGWIGFDRYMRDVLYTPGLGYYSSGAAKLGPGGDYITAPLLGEVFACCLAEQCAEILQNLDRPEAGIIVEFGAGTGRMSLDILTRLEDRSVLPERYVIIETSGDLSGRQQELFRRHAPGLLDIVQWADRIPDGIRGAVIANEVLDAMPVKRFRMADSGRILELGVALEGDAFVWKEGGPLEDDIAARFRELDLPAGYQSELGLQAEYWTSTLAEALEEGVALLIDYGFPRREYYHPERMDGTLMCHHRHVASMNPFSRPGLQDITAHVDFSAIAQAGRDGGADVAGYCSQGCFLIGNGVLGLAESGSEASVRHSLDIAQQIRKLTLPHEMGELFKVLALARNYSRSLSGFALRNIRERL